MLPLEGILNEYKGEDFFKLEMLYKQKRNVRWVNCGEIDIIVDGVSNFSDIE
jgi:hypothetical protein